MSDTLRIKYTVIVSSDDLPDDVVQMAITGLTHLFGGVTVTEGTGTWLQTAVSTQDSYTGQVGYEKAVIFGILMTQPEEKAKVPAMKSIIAEAFQGYADWVHVERAMVDGLHFSINAMI